MDIPAKAIEENTSGHRVSGIRSANILLSASIAFALIYFLPALTYNTAGLSGISSSVDDWLRARHFTFERDAEYRKQGPFPGRTSPAVAEMQLAIEVIQTLL